MVRNSLHSKNLKKGRENARGRSQMPPVERENNFLLSPHCRSITHTWFLSFPLIPKKKEISLACVQSIFLLSRTYVYACANERGKRSWVEITEFSLTLCASSRDDWPLVSLSHIDSVRLWRIRMEKRKWEGRDESKWAFFLISIAPYARRKRHSMSTVINTTG